MSYLLIPDIHVQTANIHHSSFLLGGPPVMAAFFFAHAMGRQLGKNVRVNGIAYIHHHRDVLGESFYGRVSLQQRRGAAFTFSNKPRKDYSSKNEHALSLQPVASAHLRLSLIIDIDNMESISSVNRFLHKARFSGGHIISHGKPRQYDELDEAIDDMPAGFFVMDRRDLMKTGNGKNPAQTFIDQLGTQYEKETGNTWLAAACVGYAMLTPYACREGAREGYEHAFAEPLVGLVQYRSSRQLADDQNFDNETVLWKPEWAKEDVYRLHQDIDSSIERN